jgi:hypothetical protein
MGPQWSLLLAGIFELHWPAAYSSSGLCDFVSFSSLHLSLFNVLNVVGSSITFMLASLWFLLSLRIRRALRRISKGQPIVSSQSSWPRVSVVLPVKGIHDNSIDNWQSQIETDYSGDIDFIFVVEDEHDPAYAELWRLKARVHNLPRSSLTV